MKLTKERLEGLIKQVIAENKKPSMILSEMATFSSAKSKIEDDMKTFAVFSSYRSERSARENREVDQQVRDFLNTTGYPWTVVEGGFKETPRDEEGNEIPGAEKTSEIEKSYLIFEEDSRPDKEKTQRLFDVANQACKISGQEAFSYGYPRKRYEDSEEEMFIAIYPTGAPEPGDSTRINEPWAGPWTSLDKMIEDKGYYTKIRGTKGTFTEEIKNLEESLKNTTSTLEKRAIRHKIKVLESLG